MGNPKGHRGTAPMVDTVLSGLRPCHPLPTASAKLMDTQLTHQPRSGPITLRIKAELPTRAWHPWSKPTHLSLHDSRLHSSHREAPLAAPSWPAHLPFPGVGHSGCAEGWRVGQCPLAGPGKRTPLWTYVLSRAASLSTSVSLKCRADGELGSSMVATAAERLDVSWSPSSFLGWVPA